MWFGEQLKTFAESELVNRYTKYVEKILRKYIYLKYLLYLLRKYIYLKYTYILLTCIVRNKFTLLSNFSFFHIKSLIYFCIKF